jgi:hypothetical protein
MSRASALAAAAMAASLSVHAAEQSQTAPDAKAPMEATMETRNPGPDGIPQDKEVRVSVIDGRSLKVKSTDALIHLGRPLRWVVEGLRDGQTVEIDFEVYRSDYKDVHRNVKGPFTWADHPANPVRGRFILDEKNTRVESGPSEVPGYFKYHVVLRDRKRNDVFALDPGVIVKNDI